MISFVRDKKNRFPGGLPFEKALGRVLGRKYELEVIFVPKGKMKSLNKTYRNKPRTTNVLSFSLDKKHGQIFFDAEFIKKEAKDLKTTFSARFWRLFLHGILHLKGLDHIKPNEAKQMKLAESRLLKIFPY